MVISLAPGQTISSLKERLGDEIRVVRAMPNTPAMLGAGMTGIAFGTDPFTEEEKEQICAVFKSCGGVELIEESQMEAVAASAAALRPLYTCLSSTGRQRCEIWASP